MDAADARGLFLILALGFIGIVGLGIGAAFFLSLIFDLPPPARAPRPDPLTAPITPEEIETRRQSTPAGER